MTKKEEILKEFDFLTDKIRLPRDYHEGINQWLEKNSNEHLFINEQYPENWLELDKEKINKWISLKLDELIAERDREWREHINKYFDGLIMIPSARLTKDKILDSMK